MAQSLGIKETLDVFTAAEVTFDSVVAACADGKLGLTDIRFLVAPGRAAVEAARGRQLVGAELKDLDATEIDTLVNKSVVVATKGMVALDALAKVLGDKVA